MASTNYTVTQAASIQPAAGSLEVSVADPQLTVKGLKSGEAVELRKSHDGNDPDADDGTGVIYRSNGVTQIIAKAGHKITFNGFNLSASSSITLEVETT